MPTLEKTLKKKLNKLKRTEEIKKSMIISAKAKTLATFGEVKEKRLENIKRRAEVAEAVEKTVANFSKGEIAELSKASGLSTKAVRSIVGSKTSFKQWKARKSRGIDLVGLSTLSKLIETVHGGHVSPYQAGLLFQMLRPQILRQSNKKEPTTSINIGDNRKVSVYYPNFREKSKEEEIINASDIL